MENNHPNYMTTILSILLAAFSWVIENADKILSTSAAIVALVAGVMAGISHYYSAKANKAKIRRYENENN